MGMQENIIAFAVVCSVIVGFTVFYTGIGINYGKGSTTDLSSNLSTLNYLYNISASANQSQNSMKGLSTSDVTNSGNANPFWIFLSTAWNGLMTILTFPVILMLFINDLSVGITGFGIPGLIVPSWFSGLVAIIVTITITFMILKFAKGDTSDL